jgi:hypothetical protein
MKKTIIGMVIAGVLFAALGTAGFVYAQTATPPTPQDGGYGRGMRGAGMIGVDGQTEVLHSEMMAAYAAKLNISAADLEARHDKGETMAQIALSTGMSFTDFQAMAKEVRAQVADQGVKDGKITQEQADWMKSRGPGMGNGTGAGNGRGMRGAGQGSNANPNCVHPTPAATNS